MPALALVGAAGSIFAGAAAVGAATTIGATIIGGAMIAGGALTAIGALTKNQKLMKIGGLVSLAGGVAGLATGAWSAAASNLASEVAQPISAASQVAPATEIAASGLPGAAPEIGRQALQQGIVGVASQPVVGAVDTAQAAFRGLEYAAQPAANAALAQSQALPQVAGWRQAAGDVSSWMSKNKELVNAGSGIVQGAMRNASDQDLMKQRLKDEEDYLARRRAQLSASITGLQMPTYVPPVPKG